MQDGRLTDPWGRPYRFYPQGADKFIVTGYTADGRADTDLLLTQALESTTVSTSKPKRGGIQLVD